MSTRTCFTGFAHASGLLLIILSAAGIIAPAKRANSALGQGFYFESWGGGPFGRPGGVRIDIGVPPSSPLFYGVQPSRMFPPIGFDNRFGGFGPAVPLGYRDYRSDYYNRLYLQDQAQLNTHPYRVSPLHQSNVYNYLRGLSVPPLDSVPPVVGIEPYADHDDGGVAPQTQSHQVPPENLPDMLRSAAERLDLALARRGEEGEIWRDYLAPARIIEAIDAQSDPRELGRLLLNYDGVLANSDLRWVMRSSGFAETRQLLRQYVGAAAHDGEAADGNIDAAEERFDEPQSQPDAVRDPDVPPPPPTPSPSAARFPTGRASTGTASSGRASSSTRPDFAGERLGPFNAEEVPAPSPSQRALPAQRSVRMPRGISL